MHGGASEYSDCGLSIFHFGVYAKKKWPAEWKSKMTLFNATASTVPLSESEVEIIKRQHDKKEWGYKCNDTPMCNLCDKKLCRERKFGICLLYTSPSPRDGLLSRMPSSA